MTERKKPQGPWMGLLIALAVTAVCTLIALVLIFWQNEQRDRAIEELADLSRSKDTAVERLCADRPDDPQCEKAKDIPDAEEVIEGIPGVEIDDPDPNDPDPFDDPDPVDDPDPDSPEKQDKEQQDDEIQDEDPNDADPVDDPDPNDLDPVDDPDPDDPDPDDPDPNSRVEFEVGDSCTPAAGETIVDVGLSVSRTEEKVTYTIECTTAPVTPGEGGGP